MKTRTLIQSAGIAIVLALAACAQTGGAPAPAPVAQTVTAPPSPRAECAPAHVTLYFGEQVASDEPVVTPLLNDFMARIHACEAAGGELRGITIATAADAGQSQSDARAQVQRRIERVRAALVAQGAPAAKISGATTDTGAIMSRRAEITADLY
ncbi:hypothetical protein [Terricaulis sp.]|uniref:hypothetical protein n=1 Tax=Terricaulis sp. TaxID=2768686 RepID=UPI003784E68D